MGEPGVWVPWLVLPVLPALLPASPRAPFAPHQVVFTMTDPAQKLHIPLLISPYSYTTYRGS